MTHESDWRVQIQQPPYKITHEIFIFSKGGDITSVLNSDNTVSYYKRGEAIPNKPTIELEHGMMQALADALAEKGIKPQQGYLEGKLEGVKQHLDDLRHMLKLPK